MDRPFGYNVYSPQSLRERRDFIFLKELHDLKKLNLGLVLSLYQVIIIYFLVMAYIKKNDFILFKESKDYPMLEVYSKWPDIEMLRVKLLNSEGWMKGILSKEIWFLNGFMLKGSV